VTRRSLPCRRSLARSLAGLVVAAATTVTGGCGGGGGREGMEADTAKFTWGSRSATVPLSECGREGDLVVMAGTANGLVVQVAADLSDGGDARTGVTGDMGNDDGTWGAFGAELDHGPAGEITRVAADGDRLIVEGRWARFDGDLVRDPDQPLMAGKVEARCPETEAETS
jgi:hypothetical protein